MVNMVRKESRVFKTKERAPFKICFETYFSPTATDQSRGEKKIRSTMNSSLKRSMLFEQDIQLEVEGENAFESKVSGDLLESRVSNGLK